MSAPYTAADALKFLAYRVQSTTEWALDSLSAQGLYVDESPELDAIDGLSTEMRELLVPLVESWNTYSDGRPVVSRVEITGGCVFSHIWHPDPSRNTPGVVEGRIPADPGTDNGGYTVRIVPPGMLEVTLTLPRHLQAVPTHPEDGAQ